MMPVLLKIDDLPPGYYLTTLDVTRNGKSILDGRVGVDEFLLQAKGERIEHSLMTWLTAETFFAQDPDTGSVYKRVRGSLPHTWNPLDPDTRAEFTLAHVRDSAFYIEDLHSSAITLTYAAEAYERAGKPKHKQFAEHILRRFLDFMTSDTILNDEGAIICSGSTLDGDIALRLPYGSCSIKPTRINHNHESLTCYWLVIMSRAALYFAGVGGDMEYAKSLVRTMDRAVPFAIEAFGVDIDGRRILRNYHALSTLKLRRWRDIVTGPSGKPMEYCCGTRSLPGLSFYAYARQAILGDVPARARQVLRDNAHWTGERVEKYEGWSDYESENPFFEANMYTGEGFVGYTLYNKLIGDQEELARARKWANLSYRFITDRSMVGGKRVFKNGKRLPPKEGQKPGRTVSLEWNNWGGGFFIWSFGEYLQHVGPDPKLASWVKKIEHQWRSRGFRDFLHRPWRHRRLDAFHDIPECPYLSSASVGDADASRMPGYVSPDKGAIYFTWLAPMAIFELREMGCKSRLLDAPKTAAGAAP